MMTEEELVAEIKVLDEKIRVVELKIKPLVDRIAEVQKLIEQKYPKLAANIKIDSRQVTSAQINIKRWKADREVYVRVLNNVKMNTQMLEGRLFRDSMD